MAHPEVLIVEDESRQRKIIKKWLEKDGICCVEAEDGVQGLEMFEKHNGNIKLVILDLLMPNMGGEEFLKTIRENNISAAPVIICTWVPQERIKHLDVFAMFSKPVDHNTFMSKVNNAFYFGKNRDSIISKMQRLSSAVSSVNNYSMA